MTSPKTSKSDSLANALADVAQDLQGAPNIERELARLQQSLVRGDNEGFSTPALIDTTNRDGRGDDAPISKAATVGWQTEQYVIADLRKEVESQKRLRKFTEIQTQIGDESCIRYLTKKKSHELPHIHLGRAKRNDVVIPDSTVSAIHARVEQIDDAMFLIDCSSSNGTWVNGRKLVPQERHILQSGDLVKLGQRSFYYLAGDHVRVFLKMRLASQLAQKRRDG